MAVGKKSFVAYADWKNTFDELPNEEAGALIKHIFAYVNDENPESDSILIRAIFANIKATLKRDLDKWENQLSQRSEAGKRSAEIRALNKINERSTVVDEYVRNSTDSVNVSVSVNDNTITSTQIIKFDDAVKICLFDDKYSEDIERVYKIPRDKVRYALTDFQNHCKTIGENQDKTLNQFKKHFTNWVRIKKTLTT